MQSLPQAVVALAGARDHYQLPLALDEAGLLHSLVTDVYWPADQRWFARSAGALLPRRVIAARYCAGLDSRRVRVSAGAWTAAAVMKAARTLRLNRYKDVALSRKARRVALREGAALFCYSYYASAAFNASTARPAHRFLFQLHPHPQAVRDLLLEEIRRVPQAKASLLAEYELGLSEAEFAALASEPRLANGWVAASRFTAQTLSDQGIPAAQVHVIPYGVDPITFTSRLTPPAADQPFTVVYVGSLSQRKGLTYLLDAVRLLKSKRLRVRLCGRGVVDTRLLAAYADIAVEAKIGLSHSALIRELHSADVFALPSLAEGFGHVILEAMSCGLPVITTPHTCGPDVIESGKHGWIVPIRDSQAIAERLAEGMANRAALAAMGEAAAVRARQFTWERFRAGVRAAYQTMVTAPAGEVASSHVGVG